MWLRWFPWRLLVSRAARARGLIDPVKVLSRLESFAQPLEGKVPLELIRAGLVFHSRGLLNTGAIQHNLDWIWPFWVERQYDPADDAFIPRAFSITHVNLTHRNWTAIGVPDHDCLPIVDPRGLVTPFWDGWSLDGWIVARDGRRFIPSKLRDVSQRLELEESIAVVTRSAWDGMELLSRASVEERDGSAECVLSFRARSASDACLVVALRPYNPEGVSFVEEVRVAREGPGLRVGRHRVVLFDTMPDRYAFSDYHAGDVHTHLFDPDARDGVRCKVGMATAAALYEIGGGGEREAVARVPLEVKARGTAPSRVSPVWDRALSGAAILRLPEKRMQSLFDAAVRSLVLHSPGEVYPGPYTYKRFWFRDAAFILHALLCLGLADRVERALDTFPRRQAPTGLFHSQEGEWDSNGEALWILHRYCELAGRPPKPEWRGPIERGARWIRRNRLPAGGEGLHAGLLPPGFSAEHLGPNNYYYWDDFWGIAGLLAAFRLLPPAGGNADPSVFREEAERFRGSVEKSLAGVALRIGRPAMPASPYRRLDSGAVGSLVAGYPLQIFDPRDIRLLDTAEFLLSRCLVNGGFYQDIIHSGVNPYLTLHIAQVLLRAGDGRYRELVRTVARLASPTGQWPEAVHPRTGGGCMGDGHHVWASAEWVLMIRNMFVREEEDRLVLASGILPEWMEDEEPISLGPAPTAFGEVRVEIFRRGRRAEVRWSGSWRRVPRLVEVMLPGFPTVAASAGQGSVLLDPEAGP
ncbi:MAG: hypothetical protein ACM3OG_08600 [Actinomycetota bacterium]